MFKGYSQGKKMEGKLTSVGIASGDRKKYYVVEEDNTLIYVWGAITLGDSWTGNHYQGVSIKITVNGQTKTTNARNGNFYYNESVTWQMEARTWVGMCNKGDRIEVSQNGGYKPELHQLNIAIIS